MNSEWRGKAGTAIAACLWVMCGTVNAQVTEGLKAIGMENIQCAQTPETTTVSFENNVYRSTYSGVGKAVDACLKSHTEGNLQLVVLETGCRGFASVCRTP